jgi:hypothetical protein
MPNPTKNVTQVQLSPNQEHLYYLQNWLPRRMGTEFSKKSRIPSGYITQSWQDSTNQMLTIYSQIRVHYKMGVWSQQEFDSLWVGPSGDRIPVFSASVQTRPGANPASRTMGSGSVSRGKRSGSSVDHPPPSSANVKDRATLLPSGPSWPVLCWPLRFTFNTNYLTPEKLFFRPTQNNSIWNGTIQTKRLRLQVGYNTWWFSS